MGELYNISGKSDRYYTMWIFITALLLMPLFPAFPQDTAVAAAAAGTVRLSGEVRGPYSLVERSDWSRYDNGKYIGHVYREVRASIIPQNSPSKLSAGYRGKFFVMEETLRDMRQSARAVDAVVPVSFRFDGETGLIIDPESDDRGFPSLRNFPAFPSGAISPGSKWVAKGKRAVDPLNEGKPVVIPLIAEYEYRGVEDYRTIPVHRIFAKYASRYEGQGGDFQVQGTHNVDILIRVSDGIPLMMRDTLDETYFWPKGSAQGGASGSTIRFRGFTLTFGDGLVPLDRDAFITAVSTKERTLPADSGIDLAAVPEGVKLTISDIRFEPDSDEMLASERPRLDMLARILKEKADRTFLVEGHTAAIGRSAGEMALSVRRAKQMVDELTNRGIPAERFIYKGWGGTNPLGDNANDAGRRRNRRVEITILE
ncbi:cell envelope biogenesis protein OmpA [Spirochaetia bacterium]|nr:cell envelope biogenesis protein OmpA [Spirochaetia bacterium]